MINSILSNPHNIHVMIDLETLDLARTSVVTEIGVYAFSGNEEFKPSSFYAVLEYESQLGKGRTISQEVVKWHMAKNTTNFILYAGKEKASTVNALLSFKDFIVGLRKSNENKKIYFWANPTMFDILILKDLFESFTEETGLSWSEKIFHHTRIMDYRTMKSFIPIEMLNSIHKKVEEEMSSVNGSSHNGLYDAMFQSKVLMEINKALI